MQGGLSAIGCRLTAWEDVRRQTRRNLSAGLVILSGS